MKKAFGFSALLIGLLLAVGCGSQTPTTDPGVKMVGNSTCPVSGNPVGGMANNPTFYSDYNGYRVGFMCPVCKGKYDDADDKARRQWLEKALASVGKTTNDKQK
jgi:hypothetical protein